MANSHGLTADIRVIANVAFCTGYYVWCWREVFPTLRFKLLVYLKPGRAQIPCQIVARTAVSTIIFAIGAEPDEGELTSSACPAAIDDLALSIGLSAA